MVSRQGKQNPNGPPGSRQGINGYTNFMAGDPEMEGNYLVTRVLVHGMMSSHIIIASSFLLVIEKDALLMVPLPK